jgi:hypothetical protein
LYALEVERLMKIWKPTAAGILSIIGGTFILFRGLLGLGHIGTGFGWPLGTASIVLGLIAIVGGIFAIRRRVWGLALTGAICAVFPTHPYGSLIWTPVLGILAIVFVALSKNEFSSSTPKPS